MKNKRIIKIIVTTILMLLAIYLMQGKVEAAEEMRMYRNVFKQTSEGECNVSDDALKTYIDEKTKFSVPDNDWNVISKTNNDKYLCLSHENDNGHSRWIQLVGVIDIGGPYVKVLKCKNTEDTIKLKIKNEGEKFYVGNSARKMNVYANSIKTNRNL